MSARSWTLLLHGGARTISPKQAAASRRGCLAAAWVGQRVLHGGGAALDAVEAIVRELEDDTPFNAGRGRSEEHPSELQSLMRISYAVFFLNTKTPTHI